MNIKIILLLILFFYQISGQDTWTVQYQAFNQVEITDLDGWIVQNSFQGKTFTKCGSVSLVGGYSAFGTKAIVVKQLRLPPHYKVKLSVQIWKIDDWNNELMLLQLDDQQKQLQWSYSDGSALICGSNQNSKTAFYNIDFEISHNSPTVTIILSSNLNEAADNESWGFRDLTLSIARCDQKCQVCGDAKIDNCFQWVNVAINWNKQIQQEGWSLDGEGQAEATICAGVQIFGGYNKIGRNANLWKKYDNLPPHYAVKVKVQLWKIDTWENTKYFILEIDDQEKYKQAYTIDSGWELCGYDVGQIQGKGYQEKIVNLDIEIPHTAAQIKILMKSTLNELQDNESWGVRDFLLYAAQCWKGCLACTGASENKCTSCSQGYVLTSGKCVEQTKWLTLIRFFFQDSDFQGLQGWIVTDAYSNADNPYSTCNGNKLFGGYTIFGNKAKIQRSFTLPKHNQLKINFILYKIDSWDDETFQVYVDGVLVSSLTLGFGTPYQGNICGNSPSVWHEYITNYEVIIKHTNSVAVVMMTSTLDQPAYDESWGIRQFQLQYDFTEECVELYTECGYKGNKYEVCKDNALPAANIIQSVKSIIIPPGINVQLFDDYVYNDKTVRFTSNQECLD